MTVQALDREWFTAEVSRGPAEFAGGGRRHLRVVGPDEVAVHPRMRITARGRLVCTLFAFGLISLACLLAWARFSAPDVADTHAITVESGETLSQIAVEELPTVPVDIAVMRIQLANDMKGSAIVAGQELVIPGRD